MVLENKAELVQAASLLVQLGFEVEKARQKLKALVESGVSYESAEMMSALHSFQQLECQWKETEQAYLLLREKITNGNK